MRAAPASRGRPARPADKRPSRRDAALNDLHILRIGFAVSTSRRQTLETIEDRERLVRLRAALDRGVQQPPRIRRVAALERRGSRLQQLPFALPLGDRATGTFDVGASAGVAAVEKEDARPNADCQLVLSVEIMVEAGEEKLLDSRV